MAFCVKCGAALKDGVRFCQNCGQPVSPGGPGGQNGSGTQGSQGPQGGYGATGGQGPQGGYGSPGGAGNPAGPSNNPYGRQHLKDDRGLLMYILLSIVTLGIYSYYFIYTIARDMNTACEGDGENTSGLGIYILLSIITCGIYNLYWEYKLMNRMADNAPRYGIIINETGTSVLLWELLGYVTCTICRYIALHIIIKNSNNLFHAYNQAYGL